MTELLEAATPGRVSARTTVNDALLTTAAGLILALLLPLYVVRWKQADFNDASVWASMTVVMYCSVRLSLVIGRGKIDWLQGGFWVFTYVFMGLALLAQIVADRFPESNKYTDDVLTRSSFAILIGLMAYDVGRIIGGRDRAGPTREPSLEISLTRTAAVGLLGLVFVALAVLRFGVSPFLTSRNAVDEAFRGAPAVTAQFIQTGDKAAGALFQNAVKTPVFIALYLLLLKMKKGLFRNRSVADRLALSGLTLALVLANLIVDSPIGNGRFYAGLVMIAFASLIIDVRKLSTFRISLMLFLMVFLFAFSALDVFRLTGVRELGRGSSVSETLITHLDYGTTKVAHETVTYVDAHGFQIGRQLLGSVGFWVPRRFWNDKPIPTGSLVNRGFVSVSSSLWSEGYIDFGILGTVLYLGLYGWGSRRLDETFLRAQSNSLVYALMPLMVGSQFLLVRGSLTPALGGFLFLVLVVRSCFSRMRADVQRPYFRP